MPESVWCVSKGSYSDYRVLCVCPNRAVAELIAQDINRGDSYADAQVEQLPMIRESRRVTVYGLQEEIWDSGKTSGRRETTRVEHEADLLYPENNRPVFKRWVRPPIQNERGGRLEVHGTDLERVRKVFSDTRAQLLTDDALRARKEFHS